LGSPKLTITEVMSQLTWLNILMKEWYWRNSGMITTYVWNLY